MKQYKPVLLLFIAFCSILFAPLFALAQPHCDILQIHNGMNGANSSSMGYWFGFMELPFLFIAVFFAFLTAYTLGDGKFAKGMKFMAWGFLVMAVGHLHMQIEHYYGYNLFQSVLGRMNGSIAWFCALILTWALSGMGFYSIYRASKGH